MKNTNIYNRYSQKKQEAYVFIFSISMQDNNRNHGSNMTLPPV